MSDPATESPAEDVWLNTLADEAEREGLGGSVPLEEMAAILRTQRP